MLLHQLDHQRLLQRRDAAADDRLALARQVQELALQLAGQRPDERVAVDDERVAARAASGRRRALLGRVVSVALVTGERVDRAA